MLNIHSIDTFSTQDGPGIRMVIFLQGCKFRCLYCHNPDTIPIKKGKKITQDDIIKSIKNDKVYFKNGGGITFSGGEPTLQARELLPLCQKIKEQKVEISLDTNGYFLNDDVKDLLQHIDLVILDLKHIDEQKHMTLTSRSNKNTLAFLDYLESSQKPYWIRHVLVPGYTNDESDLHRMGECLTKKKYMERFEFLPYHTMGVEKRELLGWKYGLEGVKVPSKKEIQKAWEIMSKYIDNIIIMGGYTSPQGE